MFRSTSPNFTFSKQATLKEGKIVIASGQNDLVENFCASVQKFFYLKGYILSFLF